MKLYNCTMVSEFMAVNMKSSSMMMLRGNRKEHEVSSVGY